MWFFLTKHRTLNWFGFCSFEPQPQKTILQNVKHISIFHISIFSMLREYCYSIFAFYYSCMTSLAFLFFQHIQLKSSYHLFLASNSFSAKHVKIFKVLRTEYIRKNLNHTIITVLTPAVAKILALSLVSFKKAFVIFFCNVHFYMDYPHCLKIEQENKNKYLVHWTTQV